MRKIIMLNWISIDGFFAGPNGEIDWFVEDPEVDKFVHEPVDDNTSASEMMQPGTILFGRITYQLFERHWPSVTTDPDALEGARTTADQINLMTKLVFSRTLEEVTWENSELIRGDLVEEVRNLKEGEGSSMMIFGSGTIVQQLAAEGLIDDFLIVVTPVILGEGKPLFKDVKKFDLELVQARSFMSGNVVLHYRQAN